MPLSSDIANFILIDFNPKATSFSSNDMFFAPCFSIMCCAWFSISLRFEFGEAGIILTIIAAMLGMSGFIFVIF